MITIYYKSNKYRKIKFFIMLYLVKNTYTQCQYIHSLSNLTHIDKITRLVKSKHKQQTQQHKHSHAWQILGINPY